MLMEVIEVEKKYPAKLKEEVEVFGEPLVIEKNAMLIDKSTRKKIGFIVYNAYNNENFLESFEKVKYPKSHRLSGLISSSQIFGYAPRDYIKGFPCRKTRFSTDYTTHYKVLDLLGVRNFEIFKKHLPEEAEVHQRTLNQTISNNWIMPNGHYTSGIINNSTQLRYHTDNGNVKSCYSAMLSMKRNSKGGNLHLPEYNVLIKNHGGSLLIFDGASTSHGVTKFYNTKENSKRFTIVWYCLRGLSKAKETSYLENKYFNEKASWKDK